MAHNPRHDPGILFNDSAAGRPRCAQRFFNPSQIIQATELFAPGAGPTADVAVASPRGRRKVGPDGNDPRHHASDGPPFPFAARPDSAPPICSPTKVHGDDHRRRLRLLPMAREMAVTRWRRKTSLAIVGLVHLIARCRQRQRSGRRVISHAAARPQLRCRVLRDRAEIVPARHPDTTLESPSRPRTQPKVRRVSILPPRQSARAKIRADLVRGNWCSRRRATARHPAFSKMFVRPSSIPISGALLATRRLRSHDKPRSGLRIWRS